MVLFSVYCQANKGIYHRLRIQVELKIKCIQEFSKWSFGRLNEGLMLNGSDVCIQHSRLLSFL
jgi:hypothetical protein